MFSSTVLDFYVKSNILNNWALVYSFLHKCGPIKARSHDPFLRIRFLLVSKIGSCEHIENDLPTHESEILKKWMEIEHAPFSSDTLLER